MPFKSIPDTMHEWKQGQLHSGKGGPVVKSQKQAIAIALSEARRAGKEPRLAAGKKRSGPRLAVKK